MHYWSDVSLTPDLCERSASSGFNQPHFIRASDAFPRDSVRALSGRKMWREHDAQTPSDGRRSYGLPWGRRSGQEQSCCDAMRPAQAQAWTDTTSAGLQSHPACSLCDGGRETLSGDVEQDERLDLFVCTYLLQRHHRGDVHVIVYDVSHVVGDYDAQVVSVHSP